MKGGNFQDQTEEELQNSLKNLTEKSANIEKLLERGEDVIVIQLGSHSIKYGFSTENPEKIRNLVAYKRNKPLPVPQETRNEYSFEGLDADLDPMRPVGSSMSSFSQMREEGTGSAAKPLEVFGDAVVFLDHRQYIIRQPIKYGLFNIRPEESYMQSDVLNDLCKIIRHIMVDLLELPASKLTAYSLIITLPNEFHRGQCKALIGMLFTQFSLKAIYMHIESVLALYGTSNSLGCVVDIGSDKIHVSCVDEGFLIPGTSIKKHFGLGDLNHLLAKELKSKKANLQIDGVSVPLKGYKPDHLGWNHCMEIIREKITFKPWDSKSKMIEGIIGNEHFMNLSAPESLQSIPRSLFAPGTLNSLKGAHPDAQSPYFNSQSKYFVEYSDPDDYQDIIEAGENAMDVFASAPLHVIASNTTESKPESSFLVNLTATTTTKGKQTMVLNHSSKEELGRPEAKERKQEMSEIERNIQRLVNTQMQEFVMESLEEMIIFSLTRVKDIELRKKLSNNIILCGGGAEITGIIEALEDRLIQVAEKFDSVIERVEVLNYESTKNIYPLYLQWTGASVLPKLESMKDLWITRERWFNDVTWVAPDLPKEDSDEEDSEEDEEEEEEEMDEESQEQKGMEIEAEGDPGMEGKEEQAPAREPNEEAQEKKEESETTEPKLENSGGRNATLNEQRTEENREKDKEKSELESETVKRETLDSKKEEARLPPTLPVKSHRVGEMGIRFAKEKILFSW